MPGRKRKNIQLEDVRCWIKQGYGQGTLERHKPWIRVQDISSPRNRQVSARYRRVYSSITVRHFSCWPLAQGSKTKSQAHTSLASLASSGRGRFAATSRRRRLVGTCGDIGTRTASGRMLTTDDRISYIL